MDVPPVPIFPCVIVPALMVRTQLEAERQRAQGKKKTGEETMKEITIFAQVVAKPISFPNDIKMLYHCLDEREWRTGESIDGEHLTWEKVQRRFRIDADFAKECEGHFGKGESPILGNLNVTIEVDD